MDSVFVALLSLEFFFYCIAVGAVVFVIRKLVEYGMLNWWPLKQWRAANKESKLWRDLILPILPIVIGCLGGVYVQEYPYPASLDSASGHIIFGLVAGFSSGLAVKIYNTWLTTKVKELMGKLKSMMK